MNIKLSNASLSKVVLLFLISILIISIGNTQLIKGNEYFLNSSNLIINSDIVKGRRGIVYDRDSTAVALNKEVFFLKIINNEANLDILNSLELKYKQSDSVVEVDNISEDIVLEISSKISSQDIVESEKSFSRYYTYPYQLSHIIGYVLPDENNSFIGKSGLESDYEDYLKPVEGVETKSFDIDTFTNSISGKDIYLTLDMRLQNKLYGLLEDYNNRLGGGGGGGVVMNADTGEIIAMASFPGYNTNNFVDGVSEEYFNNLLNDRNKPLLDKSFMSAFTPGSIFKIITATSLLNNKVVDEYSTFYSNRCISLGNYPFCEFGRFFYGTVNLVSSLVKSSNLFYCNYLLKQEEDGSMNQFFIAGENYGIGVSPLLDLAGSTSGNFSYDDYNAKNANNNWFQGETCNIAIGQGETTVSPLQMALAVSTLHNSGFQVKPHVVNEIKDQSGNTIYKTEMSKEKKFEITEHNKSLILEGMSGVAYDFDSATYPFLQDLPNNIKAKTGSAETVENINGNYYERTHGWIVGLYDYEGETYSFAFFIEYGQGGFYVAPLLRDYIQFVNSL